MGPQGPAGPEGPAGPAGADGGGRLIAFESTATDEGLQPFGFTRSFTLTEPSRVRIERDYRAYTDCPGDGGLFSTQGRTSTRLYDGSTVLPAQVTVPRVADSWEDSYYVRVTLLSEVLPAGTYQAVTTFGCSDGSSPTGSAVHDFAQQVYTLS